jgi:hypothetical protein
VQTISGRPALFVILVFACAAALSGQQVADPNFDASVKQPAYAGEHPRVEIDEAHHNFHTATGRYEPFARLLRNDGYDVQPHTTPFSALSLADARVLVIANALGAGATANTESSPPAFTPLECNVVLAWVNTGGSLLLISDHTPMGEAAEGLGKTFGVTMGKGFVLSRSDAEHMPNQVHQLLFSRANGLLGDHPITRGRNDAERLTTVVSFAGQSLIGPPGSTPLLRLGRSAWEAPTRAESQLLAQDAAADVEPESFASTHGRDVGGRAQGLAFSLGRGRVVVLGEAALLSAQVFPAADGSQARMGMNVPGNDDKQFALNVLHWLSRLF